MFEYAKPSQKTKSETKIKQKKQVQKETILNPLSNDLNYHNFFINRPHEPVQLKVMNGAYSDVIQRAPGDEPEMVIKESGKMFLVIPQKDGAEIHIHFVHMTGPNVAGFDPTYSHGGAYFQASEAHRKPSAFSQSRAPLSVAETNALVYEHFQVIQTSLGGDIHDRTE